MLDSISLWLMQDIEPHYNWRGEYTAEEDPRSPFFGREYSEFEYTDRIYNHVIHPQWDNIGSPTLFIKILKTDYDKGFCIIELFGEWNDCLHNDIMFLKREIADHLMSYGINKFILIAENVLNFHGSDDCYYEEWFEDVEDGWVALLNARYHILDEMKSTNVDSYFLLEGQLNEISWRTYNPTRLFQIVDKQVMLRLEF